MDAKSVILALAVKHQDSWFDVYEDIKEKVQISSTEVNELTSKIDCSYITILDENYPKELKKNFRPPFVIYYEGDLSLLNNDNLIYVYGSNKFDIDKKDLIIQDSESKKIVIGGGLKMWLSNYDSKDNLKLSALASKVIIDKVIEDLYHTEARDLVGYVLNAGKEIYVTPTAKPSRNNSLIKQGAFLIDKKEDLYD